MDWLISIIYIVVVLGVLVVAHEWGHFYVAKLCKMRVDDFSLFFGPRLWRIGKFDGTEYNIRCIPMGGFVKIAGMEPEESDAHILPVPSAFGVSAATSPKSKTMVGLREEALEGISPDAVGESIKAKVDEAIGPDGKLTDEGRATLNNSGAVDSDERRYIAAILEADKYRPDPSFYNQKPLWQRVFSRGPTRE